MDELMITLPWNLSVLPALSEGVQIFSNLHLSRLHSFKCFTTLKCCPQLILFLSIFNAGTRIIFLKNMIILIIFCIFSWLALLKTETLVFLNSLVIWNGRWWGWRRMPLLGSCPSQERFQMSDRQLCWRKVNRFIENTFGIMHKWAT